MTGPLLGSRRIAVVTAVNATTPPTVSIQVGGDTTATVNAPYLASYAPQVGDVVVDLSTGSGEAGGSHMVIGGVAPGARPTQTGTGTATVAVGAVASPALAVTFPVAYAAAPVVVVCHDSSVGGVAGGFSARVTVRSTTGFSVVTFRTDGTVAGAGGNVVGFAWVAVG